jgi:chemotaxis protein MotB
METLSLEREVMIASLQSLQEAREQLSEELSSRTSELDKRNQEFQALTGTYDGLVEDLESEVSAGRIQIEQLKEGVRLNLPQEVLFPLGSSKLAPEGEAVLHKVAGSINTNEYRVEVQGHTDNLGIHGALAQRYPTNWELAGARAARVVRLLEEGGVNPNRLTAVSMGAHQPVASNDSEEGRALNRRIEIRLLRIKGPQGEAPDEVLDEAPGEEQGPLENAAEKNQEKAVEAPAVAE